MSVVIYQNPKNSRINKKSSSKSHSKSAKNNTPELFIPTADSQNVTLEEAHLIFDYMIENYNWRSHGEAVEIASIMNLKHCDLACDLDFRVFPTTSTTTIQDFLDQIMERYVVNINEEIDL